MGNFCLFYKGLAAVLRPLSQTVFLFISEAYNAKLK